MCASSMQLEEIEVLPELSPRPPLRLSRLTSLDALRRPHLAIPYVR
jgi:hypothetical protein